MMAPVYMSTPLPRTLDSCLAWAVRFGHQQHQRANVSPLVMLPLKGLHVGVNAGDALRFVSLSLQICMQSVDIAPPPCPNHPHPPFSIYADLTCIERWIYIYLIACNVAFLDL